MRNFQKITIAAGMMLVITGCPTGPSAGRFVAGTTGGATVKLKLDDRRVRGELLEVRDSALVVADGCQVSVIPFRTIRSAGFRGIDLLYERRIPNDEERDELKAVSRFPGGMPPGVEDQIARACTTKGAMHHAAPPPLADARVAEAFLATARRETRRYMQLDSAIAAGYRRIGGDVPSLGEHWIHPAMVMSGKVDASRPSVLIYARTPDGPVFAGVAWTVVLKGGEAYPDFPVGGGAWHEHNGTVAEETLPLNHHPGGAGKEPTRVAILHAWIGIENPRGVWVADNWALPFARAGLRADSAPVAVARALSLTAPGAGAYYERVIAAAAGDDSVLVGRARVAIAEAATEVDAIRNATRGELAEADLAKLAAIWDSLWVRLASGEPQREGEAIARLAEAMR